MSARIFLARNGQIHGPFSQGDLDALIAEGKISNFSWMWNAARSKWESLDPCPSENPDTLQKSIALETQGAGSLLIYAAHGSQPTLAPGTLLQSTVTGCEVLIQRRLTHTPPRFALSSIVNLNTEHADGSLREKQGKILSFEPQSDGWLLRVKWLDATG